MHRTIILPKHCIISVSVLLVIRGLKWSEVVIYELVKDTKGVSARYQVCLHACGTMFRIDFTDVVCFFNF